MSSDHHHHPKDIPHRDHTAGALTSLRDRIGPMQRMLTNMRTSEEAGRGLRHLEAQRIAGEVRIAETAVALETTKICTALVARAMPAIGGLTTTLNTTTSAVDAALTRSCAGDVASHIGHRHQNRTAIRELEQAGQLSPDEAQILIDQLEHDLGVDVARSRQRMTSAKDTVADLHGKALAGIDAAKSSIDTL